MFHSFDAAKDKHRIQEALKGRRQSFRRPSVKAGQIEHRRTETIGCGRIRQDAVGGGRRRAQRQRADVRGRAESRRPVSFGQSV
jgi:hypothetical protein